MLIQNATAEVHAARRLHQREIAERHRFRRLVGEIDLLIESCEETHLQGIKECPPDLKGQAAELLGRAARIVDRSGNLDAVVVVEEQTARNTRKVTEVMDMLWTVQEVAFDLMLPWRSGLPEDIELPGIPTTWRYDSAA